MADIYIVQEHEDNHEFPCVTIAAFTSSTEAQRLVDRKTSQRDDEGYQTEEDVWWDWEPHSVFDTVEDLDAKAG